MPFNLATYEGFSPAGCLPCCEVVLAVCPPTDRMLLPARTEFTGDWYADCATASAVLTDALQVSNCVGFNEGGPGMTAFTATDGGTSLTLQTTDVFGVITWGSVNCVASATMTITGTVNAGSATVDVFIYDDTGTLVESSGIVASPFVSAALPYTGRYIVRLAVNSSGGATVATGVITSSGTLSVNAITALYDNGGADPSCLDCGDSC